MSAGQRRVRGRWLGRVPPALAFALPLVLYISTLAPGLLNDDPGEYQLVLGALGVAHPTGYPLYTLAGHWFTKLIPFGDIAWRVNLFSALAGALACMALYALLRQLGVSWSFALVATALFAVGSDAWFYATIAQTYALNSLLLALALLAFARWLERSDGRRFAVLASAAGLGATHHSTFWLVLPAISVGVLLQALRRSEQASGLEPIGGARGVARAAACFLAPLLLYLYIPLRGEQLLTTMQGNLLGVQQAVVSGMLTPHFLPGWTNVVMGSFYAESTFEGATVDWVTALGQYFQSMFYNLPFVALLALGILHPRLARQHLPLVALLVTAWLTNIIVVTRGVASFAEPPGGLYTPTVVFNIVAVGLTCTAARSPLARFVTAGALILALVPTFYFGASRHGHLNFHLPGSGEWRAYDEWARSTLDEGVLRGAVILGAWSQVTPLHYVQTIEVRRSDVSILQAPLAAPPGREFANRVLDAGMPLYLLENDDTLSAIPLRVAPANLQRLDAAFGDELRLTGYRRSQAPIRLGGQAHGTALHLYLVATRQPSADYKLFVRCARGNIPVDACAPDTALGSGYWPASLWRTGQLFEHRVAIGPDVDAEFGIYHPDTLKRLSLPDGSTTVRIPWQ